MTGHTDRGRSLNRSPAIIEESSMTHAPSAGDRCRPLPSWTVWKVGSGIRHTLLESGFGRSSRGPPARASPPTGDPSARGAWLQRQRTAEDLAHDLVAPAADRAEARVAGHALELGLVEIA